MEAGASFQASQERDSRTMLLHPETLGKLVRFADGEYAPGEAPSPSELLPEALSPDEVHDVSRQISHAIWERNKEAVTLVRGREPSDDVMYALARHAIVRGDYATAESVIDYYKHSPTSRTVSIISRFTIKRAIRNAKRDADILGS